MTQTDLAKRMKAEGFTTYSQTKVVRNESGERDLRLAEAFALSRIFGVTLETLAGGTPGEEKSEYDLGRIHALAEAKKAFEGLL